MNKQVIVISKDKSRLDLHLIYDFLKKSYWAKDRTLEVVEKSINNSICFGVYYGGDQIGFARVITDKVTFAYIADLFILEPYRGLGYSKKIMSAILSDSDLLEVKKWYLITGDAQSLYEKFGFVEFNDPEKTMMFTPAKKERKK